MKMCLSLIRTGRNAGKIWYEPLIYTDAFQEDLLIQELVVVVQEDRRPVHWGKADCRDAHLEAINITIMWHRTKGMGKLLFNNVVQQNEWRLVLTARINRLSVAAGNISFSRVIFLQWSHWHRFYDIRTVCLWETDIKDNIHIVPSMNLFPFNYF